MKRGNPHTIKGKGFDAHPEHINRKGAPKKIPNLDELLSSVCGADEESKSEMENIIRALALKAKRGDVRAAELLLDRVYGKVTQKIDANITVPQIPKVIYE